jgi:hypothetical protein
VSEDAPSAPALPPKLEAALGSSAAGAAVIAGLVTLAGQSVAWLKTADWPELPLAAILGLDPGAEHFAWKGVETIWDGLLAMPAAAAFAAAAAALVAALAWVKAQLAPGD